MTSSFRPTGRADRRRPPHLERTISTDNTQALYTAPDQRGRDEADESLGRTGRQEAVRLQNAIEIDGDRHKEQPGQRRARPDHRGEEALLARRAEGVDEAMPP
jgi:hypothetical protein